MGTSHYFRAVAVAGERLEITSWLEAAWLEIPSWLEAAWLEAAWSAITSWLEAAWQEGERGVRAGNGDEQTTPPERQIRHR